MSETVKLRVKSGSVELNITLTPKFLEMPLSKAAIGQLHVSGVRPNIICTLVTCTLIPAHVAPACI